MFDEHLGRWVAINKNKLNQKKIEYEGLVKDVAVVLVVIDWDTHSGTKTGL